MLRFLSEQNCDLGSMNYSLVIREESILDGHWFYGSNVSVVDIIHPQNKMLVQGRQIRATGDSKLNEALYL